MQSVFELLLNTAASFTVGLYASISPCLFPVLPMFLLRTLKSEDSRKRSFIVTAVLIIGILSSLAIYALVSVFIGLFLIQNHTLIQAILGTIIAFFGVVTMSETLQNRLHLTSLNLRSQPQAPKGLASVYAIGLGYSLLAAPCSGSALIGLFLYFGAQTNPVVLAFMFLTMAAGLSIPYLVIALVSGEARNRITTAMVSSARKVQVAVGLLLVAIGVFLVLPVFGITVFS